MNKKIMMCLTTISSVCFLTNSLAFGVATDYSTPMDKANASKVLDMTFDNNDNTNYVKNKSYSSITTNKKYVSSIKGNGYEPNNSKIYVPFSDLGINAGDNILTVSFLFKWDGEDNIIPISFNGTSAYSLWLSGSSFGFNTGKSEIYGLSNPFSDKEFHNVVAEFNFTDIKKSKIYIDGTSKTLSYLKGSSSTVNSVVATGGVTIAGTKANDDNNIKNKSIIDEVKIYKKSLAADELKSVSNIHKTPDLSSVRVNDSTATFEWTSEILPENLIWSSGYELNEQPNINLLYDEKNGMGTGGQVFSTSAYTGSYSLMTPKTRPDKGNWKFYPYTVSTALNHVYYLGNEITFKNTDQISISYMVKTSASAKVRIMADWKYEKHFTSYNVKTTEKALKGDKVLHVGDTSKFKYDMRIAFDKDPNKIEESLQRRIGSVNASDGTITLTSGIPYDLPSGTELFYRDTRWAFDDSTKTITPSDKWQLINFNTGISKSNYIDWSEYKIPLRQTWESDGNVYIDDLKVGYATKVNLYRNGSSVYSGYSNSYKDVTIKDVSSPDNVSDIKASVKNQSGTFNLDAVYSAAVDNGTDYVYNIKAVDNKGGESPLSESIVHNCKSGVKGYSYVVDTVATTVPDDTVDTTTTKITKDLGTTNKVYYLHIKTIDNAGNASTTSHIKIDIPVLTATAVNSENSMKLDWSIADYTNKTFDIYRKKTGDTAFSKVTTASGVNTYKDTGAKDLAAPNKPTVNSISVSDTLYSINLGKPNDNGTGYVFYVDSKNKDGTITTQSNITSEVKVVSGIKGYSYEIDTTSTTVPDNTVDSTSESVSVSKTTNHSTYYLHVKAIDNAENASETVHVKIDIASLTVTPLNSENSMKLEWTIAGYTSKDFDIYRKKSGDTAFSKVTTASKTNTYKDTGAKDLAAPNKPTVSSINVSDTAFSVSLGKPTDNGTGYSYYLNAIVNSITTKSNITSEAKVVSGIKGYSYEINTTSTTVPDDTVDSTSESLSITKSTNNTTYYLHVKAIDNAGNASETVHVKIDIASLTATPLNSENSMKLEWTIADYTSKDFDIYRKKSGDTAFSKVTTASKVNNYTDTGAKDLAAPNKPTINSINVSDTTFSINLGKPTDNGTGYYYYLNSIGNSITAKSNTTGEVKVISGIKGYSYSIDTTSNTTPDNTIDSTSESISVSKTTNNATYYLHVKAIDNAGNAGDTVHIKFDVATLTAKIGDDSNSMKLEWTIADYAKKQFDIYRKKTGENVYSKVTTVNGTTTYSDTTAKDLASPNKPTVNSINVSDTAFSISLGKPSDNGTGYSFYLDSIEGVVKTKSNTTNEIKVVSGLKGYSYVVDTVATTAPDNTVDSSSESISVSKAGNNATYYLHVKAIDNAGNASETVHVKIDVATLTAKIGDDSNSMKLDWVIADYTNKIFDIYRNKTGESIYSKVTTATGDNSYKDVTAKDLASPDAPKLKVIHSSADNLSVTVEKPKDNGTGYTYYMMSKTKDGTITTKSNITSEVKIVSGIKGYSYIIDTRTDTIPDSIVDSYNEQIYIPKDKVNKAYYLHIKAIDNAGNASSTVHIKIDIPTLTVASLGKDNGARLNWNMNDISNKKFNVYQQQLKSDKFTNIKTITNSPYDDFTARDIAAPDSPTVKLIPSGSTQLSFLLGRPNDYGTSYSFYITAETNDGVVTTQSNTVSDVNILSGLKGYSYVLDLNPTTIPDGIVDSVIENITIENVSSNKIYYFHIKSIDYAGNASEVIHYKVNTSKPLAPVLNLSRTGWGQSNVTFDITQQHKKAFRIASISGKETQPYIERLKALGYTNITVLDNCKDVNKLLSFDLVISDAHCWLLDNENTLKELYDRGGKLITIGDDSRENIYPILSATGVTSDKLSINRKIKNEATSYSNYIKDTGETWLYNINKLVPEASVLYGYEHNNSPAIFEIDNTQGGRWIHCQITWVNNKTKEVDELRMGLMDYITDTISQIGVKDVEYKINDGNWISYSGGSINVTAEGKYTIYVRNIDNRCVYSDIAMGDFGIDRTKPVLKVNVPESSVEREITVNLTGMWDSLSGTNDVVLSNYEDFSDKLPFTSVQGKVNVDLKIVIPFISDLEENYSNRTIYVKLFDKAGNYTVTKCSVKYEAKPPQKPNIVYPRINQLYVKKEKVTIVWTYEDINNDNVSLPQSKALITLDNLTTGEKYNYISYGNSTDYTVSDLVNGVYRVTVEVFNSFDKSTISSPNTFRYQYFNDKGFVVSKTINLGSKISYVKLVNKSGIPINTAIDGAIYYAEGPNDSFSESNKLTFKLKDNIFMSETIKLPKKAQRIKVRYDLSLSGNDKTITPYLDQTIIYGK